MDCHRARLICSFYSYMFHYFYLNLALKSSIWMFLSHPEFNGNEDLQFKLTS
jgi:hypothetical protein